MSPQQTVQKREIKVVDQYGSTAGTMAELLRRHRDPDDGFSIATCQQKFRDDVTSVLQQIEDGLIRAAEYRDGVTYVYPSVIAAINLLFPMAEMRVMESGAIQWHDKIELRRGHVDDGRRVVPGAVIRRYCYVAAKNTVYMPCFINLGAYVDEGTMPDTWCTVGSSAQVGKDVHLSGGVGLGGVLEPPGAIPVIICDDAVIGSRSQVVDGALVEEGAVLGMGTSFSGSTRVVGLDGEELTAGVAPAWATIVNDWYFELPCDDLGDIRFGELPKNNSGNVELSARHRVRVVQQREPGQRHDKAMLNADLRDQVLID